MMSSISVTTIVIAVIVTISYIFIIVIAVMITIPFILIIIALFIIVIGLSTFGMELDVAALQSARSAVTVGEYQTECVVAAALAVVSNNNRVGEGSFTVDLGNAFDLTCHEILDDVTRNTRALDLHTIVVIE